MKRWPTIRLGELAEVFNGKTPAKSEQRYAGSPVLKIKDVDEHGNFRGIFESFVDASFASANAKKRTNTGDVLILNAAHNSDYVASKIFYAGEQVSGAIATGEWMIIRSNPSAMLSGFIHYWVQSRTGLTSIKNLVRGIHLYPSDVASVQLPVPPLAEQERIVKLLDEADELRKLRAQADSRAAALIPALFHEMFGDPATNPKGYPVVRLVEVTSPKQWPTISQQQLTESGYPVFGANGKIGFFSEFNHENATVLVTCRGATCGTINVCEPKSYVTGNAMALDTPKEDSLNIEFLEWVLRVRGMADTITGSAQPQITRQSMSKVSFPVPPLPPQKKFAQHVKEIRELETRQATSRTRLDALFQSMLHLAFNGEL